MRPKNPLLLLFCLRVPFVPFLLCLLCLVPPNIYLRKENNFIEYYHSISPNSVDFTFSTILLRSVLSILIKCPPLLNIIAVL